MTRALLLFLAWLLRILLVVISSLLPATSPVMRAVGRLPDIGKVLHFGAYTWLALLAHWPASAGLSPSRLPSP